MGPGCRSSPRRGRAPGRPGRRGRAACRTVLAGNGASCPRRLKPLQFQPECTVDPPGKIRTRLG
jgi:hypothetical protein